MEEPKKINADRKKGCDTKKQRGRRPRRDRLFVEAIFWILRTGSPWRDLESAFPPWQSVYARFSRWQKKGLLQTILASFRAQSDTEYIMVDGTIVRTHQHANCPKRRHDAQAIGRSRGGLSTKLHCLCDALGYPIAIALSAGQRAESIQAEGLIKRCPKPFKYLLADTGYDSDAIREDVRQRGGIAVIKPHPSRSQKPEFDKHIYKERHKIENLFAKLKHSRRLSTRYDKSASSFLAFVCLAAIKVWLMG